MGVRRRPRESDTSNMKEDNELPRRVTYAREPITQWRTVGNM